MANKLQFDKKVRIIHALAENNSIRAIERQTDVHRDTIMRLGIRIGDGCKKIMDDKMRNLDCKLIEVDEMWGFISAKKKNAPTSTNPQEYGDIYPWT